MLCHAASNNLCPSKRLEMPAFPLHGSNFKKGVRFSVQTTSPGRVPCRRCNLSTLEWSPNGSKETTGRVVRVESTKFSEAQNKPERDCVRVIHLANALQKSAFPFSQFVWVKHTHRHLAHQSMPKALHLCLLLCYRSTAGDPSFRHPTFQL